MPTGTNRIGTAYRTAHAALVQLSATLAALAHAQGIAHVVTLDPLVTHTDYPPVDGSGLDRHHCNLLSLAIATIYAQTEQLGDGGRCPTCGHDYPPAGAA